MEFGIPHIVDVLMTMVVHANVVLAYPKLCGWEGLDVKVEDEAPWTNFALVFVVVHRLAFRWRLQLFRFKLVTLDRSAPIFGMEPKEGFVLLQRNPRSVRLPIFEDIGIW